MERRARWCHGAIAGVTAFALVFQLWLVVDGLAVLVDVEPPAMVTRLIRFFSYFTILSNILVLATSASLASDPNRDGRVWRVLRLNAIVGIIVTGVVHWFFLRPILHLSGAPFVADKLVHVAVPLLAVVGWVAFGPRARISPADLLPSLIYPVLWVGYTLVHGAQSGWYAYPFVDVNVHGYASVVLNCVGIAALVLLFSWLLLVADRRLTAGQRNT
jgi:hypothetical protein